MQSFLVLLAINPLLAFPCCRLDGCTLPRPSIFGPHELVPIFGPHELVPIFGPYELVPIFGPYELITTFGPYESITIFGPYFRNIFSILFLIL